MKYDLKALNASLKDLPKSLTDAGKEIGNQRHMLKEALQYQLRTGIVEAFHADPALASIDVNYDYSYGEVSLEVSTTNADDKTSLPDVDDIDVELVIDQATIENVETKLKEFGQYAEEDGIEFDAALDLRPERLRSLACIIRSGLTDCIDYSGRLVVDSPEFPLAAMFPAMVKRPNVFFSITRDEATLASFNPKTFVAKNYSEHSQDSAEDTNDL